MPQSPRRMGPASRDDSERHETPAPSPMSTPGCSISTTRSIRITSICGSRSMRASATLSRSFLKLSAGRSARDPEGLLPPLRHHHARHDDRARHGRRRLSHLRARHRPFAARAESGDGRCDRRTARPQADPHQRLARPCRRRAGAARHRPHFEDVFDIVAAEFEPKPAPQTYQKFFAMHGVDPARVGDVRGSRAQPRGAAPARHDHGAGGARRHQGSGARGLGDGRPRRSAMSIMSRTI